MKLDKKLEKMLNEHMNHERFNETFYLAGAAYLDFLELEGMSSYFKLHAAEEKTHFERFYDYIEENGGRCIITGIEDPAKLGDFKSVQDVFEKAVAAEELTSKRIREINDYAHEINDFRARTFLNTFELEQQEEEDLWNYNLARAKIVKDDPAALLKFDCEMAMRRQCGVKKGTDKRDMFQGNMTQKDD